MRTVSRLLVLTVLLMLGVSFAYAQEDLTQTFTAADDSYTFDFPRGWQMFELEETGSGILMNADASVVVSVFAPLGMTTILTLDEDADIEESLEGVVGFLEGEASDDPISDSLGGREVLHVEFETADSDGWGGVIEFSDGGFGGLMATWTDQAPRDVVDTLLSILGTLDGENTGGGGGNENENENENENNGGGGNELTGDFPSSLSDAGPNADDTIAELVDAEVIPEGGEIEFEDESASLEGEEAPLAPIGGRSSLTNFVFYGELTFDARGDDLEICTFAMRTNSQATTVIDIGLVNTGTIALLDFFDEDEDATVETSTDVVDIEETHEFLIIVIGEEATVYVDGDLVFERIEVVEREGSFGMVMAGTNRRTSCEAENVWAVSLDDVEISTGDDDDNNSSSGEECIVTPVDNDVNVRSGPGTEFAVQGTLDAGDEAVADGQATGSLGAVWWRLEDGGWVRYDLVDESASCEDLPTVSP
jgi:hypothetical protein